MKMVKSLLLGSAAGLAAVTAGQAADLPVKAKPVEYVKICSLYGAGFYYMPGTDLCIKVGGWTRAEATEGNENNSLTWGPFNGNANYRGTNNFGVKARGYITADVRNQTEYGTIRGYISVGISTSDYGTTLSNPSGAAYTFSSNRTFVQWAGFTAGDSQSFYDFFSTPANSYKGGYYPASDTGDGGWWVWAYTAQLGGGFSATLSAEQRRDTQIVDSNVSELAAAGFAAGSTAAGAFATGTSGSVTPGQWPTAGSTVGGLALASSASSTTTGVGAYGGDQMPDIVGNLRVDQAWGGAQLMGALHQVNPLYYGSATSATTQATGHPSDTFGFAVGAGLKLNLPMITQGDSFQAQGNYTQGASRYIFFTPNSNWGKSDGNKEAYGVLSDCVYGGSVAAGTNTSCQLTTAYGFNAGYEHYWTPSVHQSLYGSWYAVNYNGGANAMLCMVENAAAGGAATGSTSVATPGCNNNWSTWTIGSRLQWDVTKSFYLGVEVMYEDLKSATPNAAGTLTSQLTTSGTGTPTFQEGNSTAWIATIRAHRDFLP
jgi:hypothetical protein